MRVALVVVGIAALVSPSAAHPGGTDRFGCHVDSRTGLRHCHGGGEGDGEGPALVGEVGAQIELGGRWKGADGRRSSFVAVLGIYIAHDGTPLILGGGGWHPEMGDPASESPGGIYIDLSVGAAYLDGEPTPTIRADLGVFKEMGQLGTPRLVFKLKGATVLEKIEGTPTGSVGFMVSLAVHIRARDYRERPAPPPPPRDPHPVVDESHDDDSFQSPPIDAGIDAEPFELSDIIHEDPPVDAQGL